MDRCGAFTSGKMLEYIRTAGFIIKFSDYDGGLANEMARTENPCSRLWPNDGEYKKKIEGKKRAGYMASLTVRVNFRRKRTFPFWVLFYFLLLLFCRCLFFRSFFYFVWVTIYIRRALWRRNGLRSWISYRYTGTRGTMAFNYVLYGNFICGSWSTHLHFVWILPILFFSILFF